MNRREYYSTAPRNLGLLAFLHFEFQKRRKHSGVFGLISKKLDHPVTARPGTSDLAVFGQILVHHEYRCVADIQKPRLIVDLGANVGYSSAYFLSRFQHCAVIAVEPDPANFAALQNNVSPYGRRVTAIQAAAWHQPGWLDLDHPGQGQEWGIKARPSSNGNVRAVTIPELLAASPYDRISLLKIDIEGAEIELFKSDTADWLDKVDNIVIELHGDEAERVFHKAIEKRNFSITRCDELTVCQTR